MSVEGFEFQKTLRGDNTYEISVDSNCETIVVLQRQNKQTESIWAWSRVSSKKAVQQ